MVEVFRFTRKGRYFGNFINEKIFFSKFRVNKYQLNIISGEIIYFWADILAETQFDQACNLLVM